MPVATSYKPPRHRRPKLNPTAEARRQVIQSKVDALAASAHRAWSVGVSPSFTPIAWEALDEGTRQAWRSVVGVVIEATNGDIDRVTPP